jgi:hypothetical protein
MTATAARTLASIRRIKALEPITDADAIERRPCRDGTW